MHGLSAEFYPSIIFIFYKTWKQLHYAQVLDRNNVKTNTYFSPDFVFNVRSQ